MRQVFLSKVVTNLQERFPQVEVVEAFTIFDPAGLLGQEVLALEKLNILLDHYSGDGPLALNKERCIEDYTELCTFIKGHTLLKQCKSLQEFAREFLCIQTHCAESTFCVFIISPLQFSYSISVRLSFAAESTN